MRFVKEMEDLKSYDMTLVNAIPSIGAVQTTTGNCLHCIQDAGVGTFNPSPAEDESVYIVATQNCEVHKFRGDSKIEYQYNEVKRRTCGCIGKSKDRVQRERLPFAFVCANDKLIANCEQQLVRQTTRPDSGALGDCYTFAARTVEGLRTNVDRVAYLRLHMLLAARRLWAPNTIARLHEWVPLQPLGPDAIYRREDHERYNSLPQTGNGSFLNPWGTPGLRRTHGEDT